MPYFTDSSKEFTYFNYTIIKLFSKKTKKSCKKIWKTKNDVISLQHLFNG